VLRFEALGGIVDERFLGILIGPMATWVIVVCADAIGAVNSVLRRSQAR